ncbi:hypothetical protein [Lonsdalea quercina]
MTIVTLHELHELLKGLVGLLHEHHYAIAVLNILMAYRCCK